MFVVSIAFGEFLLQLLYKFYGFLCVLFDPTEGSGETDVVMDERANLDRNCYADYLTKSSVSKMCKQKSTF